MMMIRPKFPRTQLVNSQPQQESDFTAEGSPPPGDASGAGQVKPKRTATLASKVAAPPARKGPVLKSRWQR